MRHIPRRWAKSILLILSLTLGTVGALVLTMHRAKADTLVDDPNHVPFAHVIVDPNQIPNGHKSKALVDVRGNGKRDPIVYSQGTGLIWYEQPADLVNGSWNVTHVISTNFGPSDDPEQGQAGDIVGNGCQDYVVGGINYPVTWYENPRCSGQDPATTPWPAHYVGCCSTHDVELADLGNGKLDIITDDNFYIQGANADSWTAIPLPGNHPDGTYGLGTRLVDINGDGYLDLVNPTSTGMLAWFENPLGHGGQLSDPWVEHDIGPIGNTNAEIGMAINAFDVNGDGLMDVVAADEYDVTGLYWWEQTRSNGWIKHMIDPSVGYVHQSTLMIGDIDGDGHTDIAIAEQEQSDTKRIAIYYGDGAGVNWTRQILATTGGHNCKLGDLNNSGNLDILCANHGVYGAPNPVELWVNLRNGSVPPTPTPPPADTATPTPTPPSTGGGSLTGSVASLGSNTIDLTGQGTTDWAHWGTGGYPGTERKNGGSAMSDISTTGSGAATGTYYDASRNFSWSNGTPDGTVGDDQNYAWDNGDPGSGFTFTASANTTTRTLTVYAGGYGAGVSLVAHLSDGSAADVTLADTNAGFFSDVYTITYQAASAGQTLTITYTKTAENGGTGGSADLIAAALS